MAAHANDDIFSSWISCTMSLQHSKHHTGGFTRILTIFTIAKLQSIHTTGCLISPTKEWVTWSALFGTSTSSFLASDAVAITWRWGTAIVDTFLPLLQWRVCCFQASYCTNAKACKGVRCVAFFAIFVAESFGTIKWWGSLKLGNTCSKP